MCRFFSPPFQIDVEYAIVERRSVGSAMVSAIEESYFEPNELIPQLLEQDAFFAHFGHLSELGIEQ